MFRRISLSHPHRPPLHLLIALVAVLVAEVVILIVAQTAGAAHYLPDSVK
jgi:hypothetical protein